MNAKELGSAAAQVDAAVRHIEAHYDGPIPRLILTLGSGLAEIVAGLEASADFDYVSVPGFPVTRIDGHAGRLSMGLLCGVQVAVLRGREHYYERGWAGAMATPLRALRRLGAEQLVMTNAVGSLVVRAPPGSIVLMSDHINLSGVNP